MYLATDTILRLLKPGDHVLASNDVYGGTFRIFTRVYAEYGIEFSFAEMGDLQQVRQALRPNTRMIWVETPTNPLLKIADLAGIATLKGSARLVVDNTFATPYLQQPLALGADMVVHSTTKYLNGHSDVVGGALVVNDDATFDQLKFLQNAVGAVPAPLDCFLVLRGLKTLPVRMDRHCANAMQVAQFLQGHAAVAGVIYPGLTSHAGHAIAARQMRAFGGMISFIVKGGADAAKRIAEATRIFALAESLGGVESLIEVPAAMTHMSVANSPLAVDPALVRLSVGIESVADLIEDLRMALS